MSTNRRFITVGVGLVTVLTILSVSHLRAGKEDATQQSSPLAAAAFEAYKCTDAEFNLGQATVEDVYQWSHRLMQAEQADGKATALADHAARMRALRDKTEKIFKASIAGVSAFKYHATQYYALDAEQAIGKKSSQ